MTTTTRHVHKADPDLSTTAGYCGYSVRPWYPNRMAHGGVTHYERCRCGAVRMINSTGPGRSEQGEWERPDAE
jgi:hypothetical protein